MGWGSAWPSARQLLTGITARFQSWRRICVEPCFALSCLPSRLPLEGRCPLGPGIHARHDRRPVRPLRTIYDRPEHDNEATVEGGSVEIFAARGGAVALGMTFRAGP